MKKNEKFEAKIENSLGTDDEELRREKELENAYEQCKKDEDDFHAYIRNRLGEKEGNKLIKLISSTPTEWPKDWPNPSFINWRKVGLLSRNLMRDFLRRR